MHQVCTVCIIVWFNLSVNNIGPQSSICLSAQFDWTSFEIMELLIIIIKSHWTSIGAGIYVENQIYTALFLQWTVTPSIVYTILIYRIYSEWVELDEHHTLCNVIHGYLLWYNDFVSYLDSMRCAAPVTSSTAKHRSKLFSFSIFRSALNTITLPCIFVTSFAPPPCHHNTQQSI